MPSAIRRHYAKKEAQEHMQAQNALARGDMKAWHKHEAKAHRAGSHAHHGGLMHTDYMVAKENPIIVPNEPPMMPMRSMSHTMSQGAFALPPQQGPIVVAEDPVPDYAFFEPGAQLEPTIVVEPMFVEEARTVVEYGEPIAAVVHMQPMVFNNGVGVGTAMASMSGIEQYGAVAYGDVPYGEVAYTDVPYGQVQYGDVQPVSGMDAVQYGNVQLMPGMQEEVQYGDVQLMSGMDAVQYGNVQFVSGMEEEVQYGDVQFLGETVTAM